MDLAVSPERASELVDGGQQPALAAWARERLPVRAAVLDLALRGLPEPRRGFVVGIDRPLYFSVHSRAAELAPPGVAAVSLARYLAPGESGGGALDELEAFADGVQPGWRERLLARRFLPALTVSEDLPTAARGGLAGRPGPAVPGVPGLFVAGDWVGPRGFLLDAALASAEQAAEEAAVAAREAA